MDGSDVSRLMAATGFGAKSSPTGEAGQVSVQLLPDDSRLRELLEAHGSMSVRPVSFEVR
jgi:hypothetical protein